MWKWLTPHEVQSSHLAICCGSDAIGGMSIKLVNPHPWKGKVLAHVKRIQNLQDLKKIFETYQHARQAFNRINSVSNQ